MEHIYVLIFKPILNCNVKEVTIKVKILKKEQKRYYNLP